MPRVAGAACVEGGRRPRGLPVPTAVAPAPPTRTAVTREDGRVPHTRSTARRPPRLVSIVGRGRARPPLPRLHHQTIRTIEARRSPVVPARRRVGTDPTRVHPGKRRMGGCLPPPASHPPLLLCSEPSPEPSPHPSHAARRGEGGRRCVGPGHARAGGGGQPAAGASPPRRAVGRAPHPSHAARQRGGGGDGAFGLATRASAKTARTLR